MYKLSYYPWLTQNVAPDVIHGQITLFAGEVTKALAAAGHRDSNIDVLPPVDVPQQIEQIISGEAQLALMNPLGFAFARRRFGNVEAVAVAQRIIDGKVGAVYFAQLYVRSDTGPASLRAAAGLSVGYGTPYSTSNFLMPAHLLMQAGVHPLLGFRRVEFLQGHEIVARSVYSGKIAVGAGHDGVIVDLANQPGFEDAKDRLKQIGRTPPIPSDPVVVQVPDASERQVLQRAIVEAGQTVVGRQALKLFWGNTQGLEKTDSEPYKVLLQAMDDLRLTEADLLPRR